MIRELGRARLVPLLDEMNPDDRADLMKLVPAATREALLPLMAQVERNDLRKLLSYPEETAGALMTTEYVWLKRELTAEDALQKLRHVAPDSEMIYYVYVVDQERRLQGVCSLRDIICAMPGTKLGELMREHPVTVPVECDQEEVAQTLEKYELQALPVTEEGGRLVGIVTVDDAMMVMEEEATEDVQRLGGLEPLDDSYMQVSVWHLVRKRVGWLALLLGAANISTWAFAYHRQHMPELIALLAASFMPLVNSSGGNAGSQSATLITRALATGDVTLKDGGRVLLREMASALLLGVLLIPVALLPSLLWGTGMSAALVLVCAIPVVVMIGSILGTVIPLALHAVGIDPAVASAPLIASVSDVIGITTLFLFAAYFLG
jgi:magnesium transporter